MSNRSAKERDQRWGQLMAEAQKGDKVAYEQVLTEARDLVRGFFMSKIGDPHITEDLLQELLLGIHQARHTYDTKLSFSSWMFAIARYKLNDHWRRVFRSQKYSASSSVDRKASEEESADTKLIQTELMKELYEALFSLSEKQRRVLEALRLEEKSLREVSEELQMTESAVKVTAHRAQKILKLKLKNRDGTEGR